MKKYPFLIPAVVLAAVTPAVFSHAQTASTDQDEIGFTMRLGNQHFNTTNATGKFLVLSGAPAYEAVLVRGVTGDAFVPLSVDDFNNAVWTPYDGIIRMNLGPMDGVYQVDLGLKGGAADSKPTWVGTLVTLIQKKPEIFITNPTNDIVTQPYLQLQGHSPMPLASVRFDVTNATGTITNQLGFVIGHVLDPNTREYTTNYFQCYDIALTNGLNIITLYATDPAGNFTTSNINITLNYLNATNPAIQITWPQDGTQISGHTFTLRGWTDDATAQIAGTITDTNGYTASIRGLVERDGKLWVENLPLHGGTNILSLTVTNSAGFSSVTNICVVQSPLVLTMNPVTDDLWLPTVTVTGYVSDATYAVWVNGVKAIVTVYGDGTGTWIAHQVPVTEGGTASFNMQAYAPNEKQPDGCYANGRGRN
jgi:hypothetical protein